MNCEVCGKELKLGKDGACKNCGAHLCFECWEKNAHECPICGQFDREIDDGHKP